MRHAYTTMVLATATAVTLAACGKKAEPAPPAPQPAQPAVDTAAERRAREAREAEERSRREVAERARAEIASNRATLEQVVFFDYDSFDIREDARPALDQKVPILRASADVAMRIEGHADERGSVEYNLALGMRRANAVKQYLTGFGIDASRIEAVSFGEERPLDTGANEEAWARNRRAEFRITAGLADR